VVYVKELGVGVEREDAALVEKAKLEGRILLTSDVELNRRAKRAGVRSFLASGNDVVVQLVEISKLAGQKVEIDLENSRCPVCNGLLKIASKDEVKASVPANVARVQDKFWVCKSCGKVYWKGSHWKNIIEMASRYGRVVNNAESE
jgi:hypothetical protein